MRKVVIYLGILFFTLSVSPQTTALHKFSGSTQNNSVQHPNDSTGARLSALEKRVNELEKVRKVNEKPASTTEDRITELGKKINELESNLTFYKYLIDQKQDRKLTATLDASSRDYVRLDSDNSYFLVSVEDARPYLDGYRLYLR